MLSLLPSQKRFYLTTSRINLSAAGLAVCLAGLSAPYLATAHVKPHTHFCIANTGSPEAIFHNTVVSYMGIPVPACFMIVITLLIVVELRKHQKNRWSTFLQNSSTKTQEANDRIKKQIRSEMKAEIALTVMLLTATVVFILLSFPLFIYIVSQPTFDPKHPVEHARNLIFIEVAKGLEVFSHTLNFFIYFLSARKFRNSLLTMCGVSTADAKSLRKRRLRTMESHTMDTAHTVETTHTMLNDGSHGNINVMH